MKISTGLDVGTYSIKLLELSKQGSAYRVHKAMIVPNTLGIVMPAQDADRVKLVTLMKQAFKESKFHMDNVRAGIPESFVSTKIISIPPLSDQELASAIGWQAEQYIPIPGEDLQLEYHVLFRPPKTDMTSLMRVLLVGVSKSFINKYSDLYYDADLGISSLETHVLSLYRMALLDENLPTTMVIHIGSSTMDIFVVHERELAFVYSYPNGGTVLSRTIERAIGLDPLQSEEYKRTYGLDEAQLEGKIRNALLPVLQTFVAEIQKSMQYFSGSHQGTPIKRLLLSGGTAALPNLAPVLAQALPVEVAPLTIPTLGFEQGVQVPTADLPAYNIALGLALGGL